MAVQDTERILGWAAPVVFLLVAVAVGQQMAILRRRPILTTMLIVVQLASARVFWPIPVGVDDAQTFASLGLEWSSAMAILDKALVMDEITTRTSGRSSAAAASMLGFWWRT